MRILRLFGILGVLAVAAACMDLDVENLNAPDAGRALADSDDVEALLGTAFYRWVNGTKKNANPPFHVASNELTSSWGNFGMQNAGTIPRGPYDNSPTASYSGPNTSPWNNIYEGLSNAADALYALEYQDMEFRQDHESRATRARAFGKLSQGVLTGWLGLFYDQAFIFDEHVLANLEEADPELLPYEQVMDRAIAYLEEAIQIAESGPAFALPSGEGQWWIHGNDLNNQELAQWAHSFAAKYLMSLPRTPADRAQVDWNRVLYHLDRGVTEIAGFEGEQSPVLWWNRSSERPDGWVRAPYDLIGPADTSGNYETWLATNIHDRQPFLIHTADRRITGPDGPEDRGKYVRIASPCNLFPTDRGQYFQSCYYSIFYSPRATAPSNYATMQPLFTPWQQAHVRAEALLRLGQNRDQAIDLINMGRVENGELDPLPYDISDNELWEVFAYEKAIEQATSMGSTVFFDRRGFGTLLCGTPLHWPIHGRELELLQMPRYTFGGGGAGSADASTGCRTPDQPATQVVR